MTHRFFLSMLVLLLVASCGCSNSNPQGRLKIEGDVTLAEKPLPTGSIEFEPIGSQAIKTQSGGMITNGRYVLEAPQGLVPGEYRVRISSMEEVPGSRVNDPDPMKCKVEFKDIVPPAFGSKTEQKVSVAGGQPNKFDFKM